MAVGRTYCQTERDMRINAKSETHTLPVQSDKANKRTHGTEGYTPRIKRRNEATPPTLDLWSRDTYRVGDGEVRGAMRPGSEDAMKLPSRGHST